MKETAKPPTYAELTGTAGVSDGKLAELGLSRDDVANHLLSQDTSWVPYAAGVRALEHQIRQLYLEKENYRTRLLRLVQHNDLLREENEDLKKKLRYRNLQGG